MTITNLFGEVIERPEYDLDNLKPTQSLSDIKDGAWLAVDAHIIIFRGIVHIECARQFNMDPIHPVTHLCEYIEKWIKLFKAHNLNIIWVFDGISPPAKERTDKKRKAQRQKHIDKLEEYYRQGHPQNYAEVESLWKKVVYPRGDVIFIIQRMLSGRGESFMQAPMEAEAQCVRLQKDGLVEFVLSDDGDCFAYEVTNWITMLKLSSGKCCILDAEEILKRECAGGGKWNGHRAAIPVIRGCDYLPNRLKFIESMDGYVNAEDKDEYLRDLGRNNKYPPKAAGEENALAPAVGWGEDAIAARNMFTSHPVWKLVPADDGIDVDLSNLDTARAVLCPIIDNDGAIANAGAWGNSIKLGMPPSDFIATDVEDGDGNVTRKGVPPASHQDLFRMRVWARSGKPMSSHEITHPTYNHQYEIMYGALPNFSHIPTHFQSEESLVSFLSAHRFLPPANRRTREHLIEKATELQRKKQSDGPRAPEPRSLSDYRSKMNGTFDESDFLGTLACDDGLGNGSNRFLWSRDGVEGRLR